MAGTSAESDSKREYKSDDHHTIHTSMLSQPSSCPASSWVVRASSPFVRRGWQIHEQGWLLGGLGGSRAWRASLQHQGRDGCQSEGGRQLSSGQGEQRSVPHPSCE